MLSAAPFAALHADPADQLLTAAAKSKIPTLTGEWYGSFNSAKGGVFNFAGLEFTFTNETAKGKVTGVLSVPVFTELGGKTGDANFSTTLTSNDKFSLTVKYDIATTPDKVEKITFSGKITVGKNGAPTSISGKCEFIAPHNKTVDSGTFYVF